MSVSWLWQIHLSCFLTGSPGEGTGSYVSPKAIRMHQLGLSAGTDGGKAICDIRKDFQDIIWPFPRSLQLRGQAAHLAGVIRLDPIVRGLCGFPHTLPILLPYCLAC
ncbi:hypothetical protein E2C01_062586 [Portunus trituberculatus]|uniref:Uncharacterized protein n=1 Tax=Portunus trituberculatus TaxID=210409 RepID=A0A5B7HEF3_PORTR|nr:hypothetical protein [Portunus trituberculatus]